MANTVKKLFRGSVATSAADVYTVPAATTAVVTNIVLTNTTANVLTGTVKLATHEVLSAVTVPANGIFALDLKQVLDASETINADGSAAGLKLHISGMEIN
jgi:LEA14-like dessication related protein